MASKILLLQVIPMAAKVPVLLLTRLLLLAQHVLPPVALLGRGSNRRIERIRYDFCAFSGRGGTFPTFSSASLTSG